LDVREYFVLLVRHWFVLGAAVAAGLVIAGIAIFVVTPQYESTAQVVFTAQNAGDGQDIAFAGNYVQSRMQTYKDLATSPVVLTAAIDAIDSDDSPDSLADDTSIEVSQIDTVIGISVRDPDAPDAAQSANAIAGALIAKVTELESGQAPDADSPRITGVVVGPAEEEDSPASPKKALYLGAGLLAGLLIGFGAVAIRHVLGSPRGTPETVDLR
jgi:capsular polysaccharide biosynthesis protein